jgi:hypothetical protein
MNKPPYTVKNPLRMLNRVSEPPTRSEEFVSMEVAKGLYEALNSIIVRNEDGEIEEFNAEALMGYDSFKQVKAAMEAAEEES